MEAFDFEPPMEVTLFVLLPFDRMVGVEGDWTEIGINVSSCRDQCIHVSAPC